MTDIKVNYKRNQSDLLCRLGCQMTENLNHLMCCDKLEIEPSKIDIKDLEDKGIDELKEVVTEVERRLDRRKTEINKNDIEEINTFRKNKTKAKKRKLNH